MHEPGPPTSRIAIPSRVESEQAEREAQRLFRRALAAWASDALALRRVGLDRAVWGPAGGGAWTSAA